MQRHLNVLDMPVASAKCLADLQAAWRRKIAGYLKVLTVGQCDVADGAVMVERRNAEHGTTLNIYDFITAVAYARDKSEKARLKLPSAIECDELAVIGMTVFFRRIVGRAQPVLEAVAVLGKE